MMEQIILFVVAAIVGGALGCIAYHVSPTGRRNRQQIRELRAQLKRLQEPK